MRWSRTRIVGALVCLLGVLLTLVLVSAGAAGPVVKKQRIAIEERSSVGASSGTFTLIPLTPGPVKADSGTFTFSATEKPTVIRDGQRVTTYVGVDQLRGKHGTLRIPNVTSATDAASGYSAGTVTWSLSRGTGVYSGLSGGGRGAGVLTPQGAISTRYEGYVSVR